MWRKKIWETKYLMLPILDDKHYEKECPFCGSVIIGPIGHGLWCECGARYHPLAEKWTRKGGAINETLE